MNIGSHPRGAGGAWVPGGGLVASTARRIPGRDSGAAIAAGAAVTGRQFCANVAIQRDLMGFCAKDILQVWAKESGGLEGSRAYEVT